MEVSGSVERPGRGALRLLCPSLVAGSVLDLNPRQLRSRGISGLILDLDNTVVPWHSGRLDPRVREWIEAVQREGIKVCVLSNDLGGVRRARLTRDLAIPSASRWAFKPLPMAFRSALRILGTRPEQTAIVGDQLFTDILGGNRMGLTTILVEPLTRGEFPTTRLVRMVERVVLAALRRRGLLSGNEHQ